jgi:hypothetical protein
MRFTESLLAAGPSPELGERAKDLAWLVGGWSAVIRDYGDRGVLHESTGEWWFSWVLEGRAMQDVWIVPQRQSAPPAKRDRYGTTIRWFDHEAGLWRIAWFNPVSGTRNDLSGGVAGNRLIFEGVADRQRIRWSFNDITPSSFVWRGESLDDNGNPTLGSEFTVQRMA